MMFSLFDKMVIVSITPEQASYVQDPVTCDFLCSGQKLKNVKKSTVSYLFVQPERGIIAQTSYNTSFGNDLQPAIYI